MNLKELQAQFKKRKIIKLNLGCGRKKKQGYINIDYEEILGDGTKPDFRMNLLEFPYPLPDNSVDEIWMEHVLEHFEKEDIYKIFSELYRICKPNAIIKIKVPYITHPVAFTDWDHKTRFGRDSFKRLGVTRGGIKNDGKNVYLFRRDWDFIEVYNYLHPTIFGKFIPTQKLKWLISQFLWSIIYEMESHLKVIKKK